MGPAAGEHVVSFKGHTYLPKDSPWIEPVVDELRRLCRDKLSTGMIAAALSEKFGREFTRNAVCGQMSKLKISNGRKPSSWRSTDMASKPREPKPRSMSRQHQRLGSPYFGTRATVPLPQAAKAIAAVIDPATQVSLFDHREGQCRWPVTEVQPIAQFRYCGGPVVDDACPYCEPHRRMSVTRYQPAEAA
jgi:hypothetical protein